MQFVKGSFMDNERIEDIKQAIKVEAVSQALESDFIPNVALEFGNSFLSEGVTAILGELAGSIVPGINGVVMAYKQNRFERHVNKALEIMKSRIEFLEGNYSLLNKEMKEKFENTYTQWLLDNLAEEKQEEKVEYNVQGFINLMSNDANDNLMLLFFNTISELTMLDIDILKLYSVNESGTIYELCEKYNIIPEQTLVIKEKLERLGLLQSKNEEYRESNLDYVVEHLSKVATENKKSKPKDIEFTKSKIKKISRSDSFHITSLGRAFLKTISD